MLGATADPATPVGNGVAVYGRLDDGYLITQQGGPHVIFGRGNACPDDIVTAFLVKVRLTARSVRVCRERDQLKDKFVLEVAVNGVEYKYVRDGDKTKVTVNKKLRGHRALCPRKV